MNKVVITERVPIKLWLDDIEDSAMAQVTVSDKSRTEELLHYIKHCRPPDGFNWGYGGKGPAELARCILINHFNGDILEADKYYEEFKNIFVAKWDRDWEITEVEINKWLSIHKFIIKISRVVWKTTRLFSRNISKYY